MGPGLSCRVSVGAKGAEREKVETKQLHSSTSSLTSGRPVFSCPPLYDWWPHPLLPSSLLAFTPPTHRVGKRRGLRSPPAGVVSGGSTHQPQSAWRPDLALRHARRVVGHGRGGRPRGLRRRPEVCCWVLGRAGSCVPLLTTRTLFLSCSWFLSCRRKWHLAYFLFCPPLLLRWFRRLVNRPVVHISTISAYAHTSPLPPPRSFAAPSTATSAQSARLSTTSG